MANRKATPEETAARFGNGIALPGPKRQMINGPSAFDLAAGERYEMEIAAMKEKMDQESKTTPSMPPNARQLLDEVHARLMESLEKFKKDNAGKTWEQVGREYDETLDEALRIYQAGLGNGKNVLQIQADLLDKLKSR